MRRWLALALLLMVLWGWTWPGQALIRRFEEVPGQVLVQSRHTLKDDAGWAWQVVLFARRQQLQLRLVGFPERYHLRHPDPLRLVAPDGSTWEAADDFPKAETVTNVGQYDLWPLVGALPLNQPLTLVLPLVEGERRIQVPWAVVLEWAEVLRQSRQL